MAENNFLDMLSQSSEKGRIDSSLFDLAQLMFCDIPSFLDTTPEQESIDEDVINNFDKLLEELSDTTNVQNFVDEILDKVKDVKKNILGEDEDDKEGTDKDKGSADKDKEGVDKESSTSKSDVSDDDSTQGTDGEGEDANGGLNNGAGNGKNQNNQNKKSSKKQESPYEKDDNDDVKNDNSNGEPCKSVIVEFAADTVKYSHEPFVWNVVPGQQIDSSTIIAYCKQKNKILPVKSIFSKGVVRKDPVDGDFWRCWKTVTSRHIVIDCPEKAGNRGGGSSSFSYDALYDDSMLLVKLGEQMSHTADVFNIVTNHFIYVTYCHLLYYMGIPRKWWTGFDFYPSEEEGAEPIMFSFTVYEDVPDEDRPEVVFADFINNVYRPRVKKYREEIQKMVSTDTVKATKGNPFKLKKLAQSAIDLNNEFFYDIVEMYRNCTDYFRTVKIDMDKDEFCIKSWKFLQRMEFEFQVMEDDNFDIWKEKVYDKFVKELGSGHLDYTNQVSDKRDGRYCDYHQYFNNYIGHIINHNNIVQNSEDYYDDQEDYDGDTWDSSIYDSSVNNYRTNYIIKEYISAYDDHSRDYQTYFENLRGRGLETDTRREVLGDCDMHQNHEFLGEIIDYTDFMKESHNNEDVVRNMKGEKIWAAEPGETLVDYFDHITKEIFNNERYFTMKYKSLLDYFKETHKTSGDQRWKIAEEVRRFDELLDCMVSVYKEFGVTNIDGSKNGKSFDYFRKKILENFKEVAVWPEPSDYYYEPTKEYFYEHYTFLNVDEIEQIYDSKKSIDYQHKGTSLGDEGQINDYIDGINTYTGYVPEDYSDFDNMNGGIGDEDFISDNDMDSPLFGGNMMNPAKLIADFGAQASSLVNQGLAMGVYKGPTTSTQQISLIGDGNGNNTVLSDNTNSGNNNGNNNGNLNGSGTINGGNATGNNGSDDGIVNNASGIGYGNGNGGNGSGDGNGNGEGSNNDSNTNTDINGNGNTNNSNINSSDGSSSNGKGSGTDNGVDDGDNTNGNTNNGNRNGNSGTKDGEGNDNGNDASESDDDIEDSLKDTTKEKDTTAQECSVDLTKYKYWAKYFGLATLSTMMFLGCGIPLPFMACIPLPCIYIPIVVVPINKVGLIMVIGIAIRGVCILPIMLFVNLKSSENSMIIPVTMSLATLMEMMQSKVSAICDMAKMASDAKAMAVKTVLTTELKAKKEFEAKLKALKEINVEGKESIIDNFKKAAGEETRQIVTRLKSEVEDVKDEVVSKANDAKSAAESVKNDASNVIGSISSGKQEKTADNNDTVSGSIK